MSDTVQRPAPSSWRMRQRAMAQPVTELRTGLSTVALTDPDLVLAVPRPTGRPHRTGDCVLLLDGCAQHHEAVVVGLAEAGSIPLYLLVVRRLLGPAAATGLRHVSSVADVVQLRPGT